jgi:hypothetical protein
LNHEYDSIIWIMDVTQFFESQLDRDSCKCQPYMPTTCQPPIGIFIFILKTTILSVPSLFYHWWSENKSAAPALYR